MQEHTMDGALSSWRRLIARMDDIGWPAWIGAMVIAFVIFAPAGLFVLGYMIWSGRMGFGLCKSRIRQKKWARTASGNTAFDAYRAETLKRLDEERDAFEGFVEKLRRAKDQAEFDQFMRDQRGGQDTTSYGAPRGDAGGGGGPAPYPAS